jgi:TRAP-type C4-dicarboxylate transport system substrate-binding protein
MRTLRDALLLGWALSLLLPTAAAAQATPPAPSKPIVLKKADFGPVSLSRVRLSKWWAEEVEKRSGGRVKIEYFPAETLLKAADIFEGTRSGVADIGIWVQAYNPAVSPISALFTLPGVSPRFRPAIHAASELVFASDFAFFRDELKRLGVEPLYSWGVSDQEMISTKPVASLAALKGLKVRVIGKEWPKLISEHGGTPVAMPWPEVYEALSRGTLDAVVGFVTANRDAKFHEVAKHHTQIQLGAPAGPSAIMNKKAWDGLPKDIQDLMRQVAKEYPDKLADLYEKEVGEAVREMEAKGVKFTEWPREDRAKLQASMEAIWEAWTKEMDAKGIPGREALRRYVELQKKHAR